MTSESGTAAPGPRWPVPGVRAVIDGLNDAVVAIDHGGVIRYANPAAERLLGWPPRALEGQPVANLVASDLAQRLAERFAAFVEGRDSRLAGRQIPLPFRRHDGSEVQAEAVLSMVDHPWAGRVVVAIIRPRWDRRLRRWSQLTGELMEILAAAPAAEPPLERLLSTLGRRLGWDAATFWSAAPGGALVCRQVWTRDPAVAVVFAQEAKDNTENPAYGARGLARWVFDGGEPLWVPDLLGDDRFATEAARQDGLHSACAFPIRYRGVCVGVIEMLCRRWREPDQGLVDLMGVVSGQLGELLHAFAQAAERERLVEELEEVRRSQEFLLLAARVLSEAADYRQTVEGLAQIAVPVLADLCLIDVRDEDGAMRRMAAWHADPAKRALTEELRLRYPPGGSHPSVEVMQTGQSRWAGEMTDEFLVSTARDERHLWLLKQLEFTSYMTVPLNVRGVIFGTVTLVSAGSGRRFNDRNLALAEELAAQVASVVERARVHDREQRISHELQRSLLPDRFPPVEGWQLAARYLPAAQGVDVGGDWFDVIRLSEDSVALVVGDVEGHDLAAAKAMGRLRHVLWLLVLEERSPGAALARLNRFVMSGEAERLATVLVGVLDTAGGGVTLASAGHPAPLVVEGRQAQQIAVAPGPPLGVDEGHYEEVRTVLGDGCLLMFTDGLVEGRTRLYAEGVAHLAEVAAAAPPEPELLVDYVLAGMFAEVPVADDVALLAVRRRG